MRLDRLKLINFIEKNLATCQCDSFVRGYHAYMDIWNVRARAKK